MTPSPADMPPEKTFPEGIAMREQERPDVRHCVASRAGAAGGRPPISLVRLLGLAAIALFAVACGGAQAGGDGLQTRQVLVDYVHDEVASSFLLYFPRNVTVRPGDTVEFRQEWTGEPHTVTMGTMVDDMLDVTVSLLEEYGDTPEEEIPPEALEQFFAATEGLPWMFTEDPEQLVGQNAAQPCYLDEGGPPEDPTTPCAPEDQVQPAFNGRQSYYNSGFIPYQGPEGNQFTVKLADDIEPGVYGYYCNLHGPGQSGTITVVDADEQIPSAGEVARQAREEIEAAARPLVEAHEQAQAGEVDTWMGEPVSHPFAGMALEDDSIHAFVSEFIPETLRVRTGEPVKWTFIGGHTVSFRVPEYFSQITVEDDGTVILNPDAILPVNGPGHPEVEAPEAGEGPEGPGETEPAASEPGEPEEPEGPPPEPPPPPEIDAGEWAGTEFISSGLFWDGTYTLRFTEPGTYPYACLIHPQMVGLVVVD